MDKYQEQFPLPVRVCKGFYGSSDRTSVSEGDAFNIHFVKKSKVPCYNETSLCGVWYVYYSTSSFARGQLTFYFKSSLIPRLSLLWLVNICFTHAFQGQVYLKVCISHTHFSFEPGAVHFSLHEHLKVQCLGQKLQDKASSLLFRWETPPPLCLPSYSTSRKSLNKRRVWTQRSFCV